MKEHKIDKLIEKYESGSSTLNEELLLFENGNNAGLPIEAWSAFVKSNKRKMRDNLNDRLWVSFQKRNRFKRTLNIGIVSAAASVLLIFALYFAGPGKNSLSYSEKEALLNQALGMFPEKEQLPVEENIIYENDMVIIYTTTE